MSAAEINRQIVADAYASLGGGSVDGFLQHFDQDSELIEAQGLPYGGVYRGVASIKAALISIRGFWTDTSFEIVAILADEQHVMVYARFAANGCKSGRKIDFPLVEVWRIDAGRVISLTAVYFDTALAAAALA
jgi:ketosteroid isomerase-like protein